MHHAIQKSVWMNSWQFWLFSTAQQYGRGEEDAVKEAGLSSHTVNELSTQQKRKFTHPSLLLYSNSQPSHHRCQREAAHFSVMSWKLKWRDTDLTSCRCGRRIWAFYFSLHTVARVSWFCSTLIATRSWSSSLGGGEQAAARARWHRTNK